MTLVTCGRGISGLQLATIAAFTQDGVDFFGQSNVAENIFGAHSRGRSESKDFLGRGIGLLDQAVQSEYQHAAGKVRKHGLAKIFGGASAALLRLVLYLQFMLLLFELLDHSIVEMQRQSLQRGRRLGRDLGLLADIAAQKSHEDQSQDKGKAGAKQHYCRAQDDRIG